MADAQFYAGCFGEASTAFAELEKTADKCLSAEVRLKAQLAEWFMYGNIQAKPYEAEKLHTEMVQSIERGELSDAHFALLALALLEPQNPERWAAFLHTSFLISEHKMMQDAMITAHVECGAEPYSICRQRLLETDKVREGTAEIAELDRLFTEAREIDQSRDQTPVTFRLIGENGPEVIFTRK